MPGPDLSGWDSLSDDEKFLKWAEFYTLGTPIVEQGVTPSGVRWAIASRTDLSAEEHAKDWSITPYTGEIHIVVVGIPTEPSFLRLSHVYNSDPKRREVWFENIVTQDRALDFLTEQGAIDG